MVKWYCVVIVDGVTEAGDLICEKCVLPNGVRSEGIRPEGFSVGALRDHCLAADLLFIPGAGLGGAI